MYIIAWGSPRLPELSSVFRVLEKEPDMPCYLDGQFVGFEMGWYKVRHLGTGVEYRLAPDHEVVENIPSEFIGSKAIAYG